MLNDDRNQIIEEIAVKVARELTRLGIGELIVAARLVIEADKKTGLTHPRLSGCLAKLAAARGEQVEKGEK